MLVQMTACEPLVCLIYDVQMFDITKLAQAIEKGEKKNEQNIYEDNLCTLNRKGS